MPISRRGVLRAGAGIAAGTLLPGASSRAGDGFQVPRHVLAWYYPWFWVSPDGVTSAHWGFIDAASNSCTGTLYWPKYTPYTSTATALIDRHFQWMNEAGITGIISSWWGIGDRTDAAVPLLLEAAKDHGISVAFEIPELRGAKAVDCLKYLVRSYGSHEQVLKVQGQPVFFINSPAYAQAGSKHWNQAATATGNATGLTPFLVADILGPDGYAPRQLVNGSVPAVYSYSSHEAFAPKSGITTLAGIKNRAPSYYRGQVKAVGNAVSSCVVLPRHNGTLVHPDVQNLVVDGYGGQTMQTLLEAASDADPDWIIIVSWNEWGEGSMMEPSRQFGMDSFYPMLTKDFLAKPPKTH